MRREDFVVTPANALALAQIDGWRAWPDGRMLLAGPPGAGKSHLAAIWAAETGAARIAAADLAAADLPVLAARPAVAVEDAEVLAQDPAGEAALLHLHNLLAGQGHLLVTAAMPPRDWGIALPDLLSRLQAMPLVRLDPPDDALLSAVLVKLFADRQLAVSATLIPWLIARMPRSIGAARALVAALDARALAAGRAINPRLAAEILDSTADQ
ncbi:chromosomal replication initiator DnaA [Rhodobacter sp. Har01]|uniref:chromosomal replication initiator DnaA n=1 Tax=Rhodobacter sp. Har01 TaxID=2883999 RepID=UPI002222E961